MNKLHRNTIHEECARVDTHSHLDGDQHIIRLYSPVIARHASPGSFVHIKCSPEHLLRRPLSIMQSSRDEGWIEILYKVVGTGTTLLSQRQENETLQVLGPIGKAFVLRDDKPKRLLIGGGVGMPPMIFLASEIKDSDIADQSLTILGSEVAFPFQMQTAIDPVSGIPDEVNATMPLLEDWRIANRLCSLQGYEGCFNGYVTDLARLWLQRMDEQQLSQVEIFSCGPHPMLKAVASLAEEFKVSCQVSLEEFMACAVGGCAGCVVKVKTEDNQFAMKRVCVDGPVFNSREIFFD